MVPKTSEVRVYFRGRILTAAAQCFLHRLHKSRFLIDGSAAEDFIKVMEFSKMAVNSKLFSNPSLIQADIGHPYMDLLSRSNKSRMPMSCPSEDKPSHVGDQMLWNFSRTVTTGFLVQTRLMGKQASIFLNLRCACKAKKPTVSFVGFWTNLLYAHVKHKLAS